MNDHGMLAMLLQASYQQAPKGGLSGHDIITLLHISGLSTYTYSGYLKVGPQAPRNYV